MVHLALALLPVAFAGSLTAQVVDGSVAPRNTWYTRAGCASRAGATETRPVDAELEVAWRRKFEGELEGEPLVWGDWIVVCEKRKRRSYLHSLNLRTGTELRKSLSFKTDATLAPSMWSRHLVLRSAPNAVAIYRVGAGKDLSRVGSFTSKSDHPAPLSEPLLFEDEIYLRDDQAIVRLTTNSKEVWRTKPSLSTFDGELSLWNDAVWTTRIGDVGRGRGGMITALDRNYGESRSTPLPQGTAGAGDRADIDEVVRSAAFQFARLGGEAWGVLPFGGTTRQQPGMRLLSVPLRGQPAFLATEVLLAMTDPKSGPVWALFRPRAKPAEQFRVLATVDIHPELLGSGAPVSIADTAAYHPQIGVDLGSLRVVWRLPETAKYRIVPAEDSLLARSADELVCYRARGAGRASSPAARFTAGVSASERALLSDGTVWSGKLESREDTLGRLKASVPLDEVLLVVDAKGHPLRWASPDRLGKALALLDANFRREQLAEILKRAPAARDVELLRDIITRARRADVDDKFVRKAESKLRGNLTHVRPLGRRGLCASSRYLRARNHAPLARGTWSGDWLDIRQRFGVDAESLGKDVEAYAESRLR